MRSASPPSVSTPAPSPTRWRSRPPSGFNRPNGVCCLPGVACDDKVSVMKKVLISLGLVVLAGVVIWLATRRAAPPQVPFEIAKRQTLVSMLSTNGKVEPVEWTEVASEHEGRIGRLLVRRGQTVRTGTVMVQLDTPAADSELAAAQSRLAQAHADLASLQQGGRAADLADIDATRARVAVEKHAAQRDVSSLERLLAQKAATRDELDTARDRLKRTLAELDGLARKRAALAPALDRGAGRRGP